MNKNNIFYDYVVINEEIDALNEKISALKEQNATKEQLEERYIKPENNAG